MIKKRPFICFIVFLLGSFFIGCRKTDHLPLSKINTVERFFKISSSSHPTVKALHQSIYSREKVKPFVNEFVKFGGFPIWDKAIIVSTSSTNNRTETIGQLVFIPFAKDSQNFVASVLAAKIVGTDTSIKLLYHWQYKNFTYQTDSSDRRPSAENAALIFMGFQKIVFGNKDFNIKDSLLFASFAPSYPVKRIEINSASSSLQRLESVTTICFNTYGVGGYNTGCASMDDPNCLQLVLISSVCWTTFISWMTTGGMFGGLLEVVVVLAEVEAEVTRG